MASSTELSTTSHTRWWRPLGPVDPMYIPGACGPGRDPPERPCPGRCRWPGRFGFCFVLYVTCIAMDATFPTRGAIGNRGTRSPWSDNRWSQPDPAIPIGPSVAHQRGLRTDGRRGIPRRHRCDSDLHPGVGRADSGPRRATRSRSRSALMAQLGRPRRVVHGHHQGIPVQPDGWTWAAIPGPTISGQWANRRPRPRESRMPSFLETASSEASSGLGPSPGSDGRGTRHSRLPAGPPGPRGQRASRRDMV